MPPKGGLSDLKSIVKNSPTNFPFSFDNWKVLSTYTVRWPGFKELKKVCSMIKSYKPLCLKKSASIMFDAGKSGTRAMKF